MKYSSYYLYQKMENRGGQGFIPVYPPVYSMTAGGTEEKVLHQQNNNCCGDSPAIYRTISGSPYCDSSYNKCVDTFYQVSYDNGETWEDVSSGTTIVEYESTWCRQFRWVNMDINTDYWCDICDADYSQMYFTTVAMEDNVTITFTGGVNTYGLDYSLDDGVSWLHSDLYPSAVINTGQRILWKGNATPTSGGTGIGTFGASGEYYVEGNPMSLLFGDNFIGKTSLSGYNYAFQSLFNENLYSQSNNLVSAENLSLPATTLSTNCYADMFSNCESLIKAPNLPATALTQGCYNSMFYRCTSLATAPVLSATSLSKECYYRMFSFCTSLSTAPELPSKSMRAGCYEEMFRGCTSLAKSPVLSASTTETDCYRNMFSGCTSLNEITCLATYINNWTATDGWVTGVSSSGTFKKASSMSNWTYGTSGIPSGWTVRNA